MRIIILLLIIQTTAWGGTYYVDPVNGSDTDDGLTEALAFLTPHQARDTIRGTTGNTVILLGGDYYFTETLDFITADSGAAGAVNVYKAKAGETPVFHGTVKLAGDVFTSVAGSEVKGDFSSLNPENNQDIVIVNGSRMRHAQEPDHSFTNDRAGWAFAAPATPDSKTSIKYKTGEIDPSGWSNVSSMEINVHAGSNFRNNHRRILSIDTSTQIIQWSGNSSSSVDPNDHFFVYDGYDLLDDANEFYYDDSNDFLFLYPPSTLTADDTVEVANIDRVIDFQDADYIEVNGVTVSGAYATGVNIEDCNSITFRNGVVKNTLDEGVSVDESWNVTVSGNTIYDVGGFGIYNRDSESTRFKTPGIDPNATITSNTLYRTQWDLIGAGGAIYLAPSIRALVDKNYIHDVPAIGIRCDGILNVVEKNKLERVGRLIQDTGAIYAGGRFWGRRGQMIRYNFIDANECGWGGLDTGLNAVEVGRFGYGIYLDDQEAEATVSYNIVKNAKYGNTIIHGGRDHYFHHNIMIQDTSHAYENFNKIAKGGQAILSDMFDELDLIRASSGGFDGATYLSLFPELADEDTLKRTWTTNEQIANNIFKNEVYIFPGHTTDVFDGQSMLIDGANTNLWSTNFYYSNGEAWTFRAPESSTSTTNQNYTYAEWQAIGQEASTVDLDTVHTDRFAGQYQLLWNNSDVTRVYDMNTFTYKDINGVSVTSVSLEPYRSGVYFQATGETVDPYVTWVAGYDYMKRAVVQSANIDTDQTGFPIELTIAADSDIGGNMTDETNYYDFRIAQFDGTILDYEVEDFVISSGEATATIWVQEDLIFHSGATLYFYYGNSGASDGSNPSGVWDANFMGVYHLEESSGSTAADSTSNANNGTYLDGLPDVSGGGKVGNGQDLDGTDDYINLGDDAEWDFADQFTISGWIITDNAASDRMMFNRFSGGGSPIGFYLGQQNSPDAWEFKVSTPTNYVLRSDSAPTAGEWTHLMASRDTNGRMRMYVNAVLQSDTSKIAVGSLDITKDLHIGVDQNGGKDLQGHLDEIRLSNMIRDIKWIKFGYYNMGESDNEITWGSQETEPVQLSPSPRITISIIKLQ